MVLDESLIAGFGLAGRYFVVAEDCFNRHEGSIVIGTPQLDVNSALFLDLDDEVLAELISHLFLHLEILIDELIVIQRVSDERLALIALAEAKLDVSCYCIVEHYVDVLGFSEADWELVIKGQIDDFSVVDAEGEKRVLVVVVG